MNVVNIPLMTIFSMFKFYYLYVFFFPLLQVPKKKSDMMIWRWFLVDSSSRYFCIATSRNYIKRLVYPSRRNFMFEILWTITDRRYWLDLRTTHLFMCPNNNSRPICFSLGKVILQFSSDFSPKNGW